MELRPVPAGSGEQIVLGAPDVDHDLFLRRAIHERPEDLACRAIDDEGLLDTSCPGRGRLR